MFVSFALCLFSIKCSSWRALPGDRFCDLPEDRFPGRPGDRLSGLSGSTAGA